MAHVNERLGGRPCPVCGVGLVVRRNPQGTITANCTGADGCDFSGFAKKGTKAAAILTQGLGSSTEPPAPGPSPEPAPKPGAKAPPVKSAGFSLGNL